MLSGLIALGGIAATVFLLLVIVALIVAEPAALLILIPLLLLIAAIVGRPQANSLHEPDLDDDWAWNDDGSPHQPGTSWDGDDEDDEDEL